MRAGQYRRTLDRISRSVADVARSVGKYLAATDRTDDDLADAARVLHPVITAGRSQAHDTALAFLSGQARSQGYTATLPVPAPREYPVEALEKALKDSTSGTLVADAVEKAVVKTAVRHTEDSARKAVEDTAAMSAEPDPKTGSARPIIGWARQLTGAENCPFCVIMASRGAVYHSRQTALYNGGDAGSNSLSDGMRRYHNGCDCVAVPVFDLKTWEGNATARYLYSKVYKEAIKKYPEDDAFTAVRKYMIHDLADDDEGLKVPQLRKDEVALPDTDDVPDFVSTDLLSPATRDLIEATSSRLPETRAEWEEIRKQSGATMLERQRNASAKSMEEYAKKASKEATWYKKYGTPEEEQAYRSEAATLRKAAKEYRSGKRDDVLRKNLITYGEDPDARAGFEEDVNGKILPPQSYLDRVDEVQMVGRAALDDYRRALDTDTTLADLKKVSDDLHVELGARVTELMNLEKEAMARRMAAREAVDDDDDVDAWLEKISKAVEESTDDEFDQVIENARARGEEARLAARAANTAVEDHRGQLLRQIVGSRRPMAEKTDITVTPGVANKKGSYGAETPGTQEDLEKIRRAATFFPKDWVKKMEEARGGLYVTASDRAYYRAKSPFSNNPGDHINLSGHGGTYQRGAFTNYTEQIAAHEIGHRMEKTLPAISRLEWAYLTRRATKAGKREALKWVGAGAKDETAFHDEFRNAYTGKAYGNPDSRPWEIDAWEVFTTGLESLYGDDANYQDSDGDLQSFILGLLLTV